MRRAIAFIFALALFAGGGFVLVGLATSAVVIKGWMVMAGALMLVAGGAWLWADYIGPALGMGKTEL